MSFIRTRQFLPLLLTQFLGALNDNLLKTSILMLFSFNALMMMQLGGANTALWNNLSAGLFILPFFCLSALASQLAEKYDKARLSFYLKALEVLIILLAGIGFALQRPLLLLLALFLMGCKSTLFGPIKYAIIPEHLNQQHYTKANAWIELSTFIAILLGQLAVPFLWKDPVHTPPSWLMIMALLCIASFGAYTAYHIPAAPPNMPHQKIRWRLLASSTALLKTTLSQPNLRQAIICISWFWLFGLVLTTQLALFIKHHLGGDDVLFSIALSIFSIGIGLGSLLYAKIAKASITWSWVRFSGITMSLSLCAMSLIAFQETSAPFTLNGPSLLIGLCLTLLSIAAGFFIVPLYTQLQLCSERGECSSAVAANNIVNSAMMILGVILSSLFLLCFNHIPSLFITLAVANLIFCFIAIPFKPANTAS